MVGVGNRGVFSCISILEQLLSRFRQNIQSWIFCKCWRRSGESRRGLCNRFQFFPQAFASLLDF